MEINLKPLGVSITLIHQSEDELVDSALNYI